uniref:Uncharacterized protein n=1 Tax=Syphacia muris TaxID=451379 RepID=A0A0N5AMX9_9BILA
MLLGTKYYSVRLKPRHCFTYSEFRLLILPIFSTSANYLCCFQRQRLTQKAAVSHREKVERFNAAMSELTEFNDIPKLLLKAAFDQTEERIKRSSPFQDIALYYAGLFSVKRVV